MAVTFAVLGYLSVGVWVSRRLVKRQSWDTPWRAGDAVVVALIWPLAGLPRRAWNALGRAILYTRRPR